MQRIIAIFYVTVLGGLSLTNAQADTVISLASTIDATGSITENAVTGAQARIELGDGSVGDADGIYDISDDSVMFGGAGIDIFPSESDFQIGSFTVDGVTGSGIETVAVTDLDTSLFWADGSSTTDISDVGLDLWFFGLPNEFTFSAFDAGDTATFNDGLLTSIDATVDVSYSMFDGGANQLFWDGTVVLSGDTITLAINDTENFDTGFGVVPSTLTMNFTGTVGAVGSVTVPEPGSILAVGMIGSVVWMQRRRQAAKAA